MTLRPFGARRPAGALLVSLCIALICGAACDRRTISDPEIPEALDTQLREQFQRWGVMPIGALAKQNPAMVDLGRALFFDRVLSGNRDVSCATCHSPLKQAADGLSLSIGTGAVETGATRTLGAGRQFVPRNAPSLLNQGLGTFYIFWDGRVSEQGSITRFKTPAGAALPQGLTSALAAQAMLPVANRVEMRGNVGDHDVFGNVNELAAYDSSQWTDIWAAAMRRLLAINGYVTKFNAAFPGVPTSSLGFQHAANAIATFEMDAFTKTNSPFDRYLARDNSALSLDAKRGALLFFTKARCSSCHFGTFLGGQNFASVGAPQIGPGTGSGAPLDFGFADTFQSTGMRFFFRVPTLRNVELTAPYMHSGAYATLEAVVHHYNDVSKAIDSYDVSQLDPSLRAQYHGDAATRTALRTALDSRLRQPLGLTEEELKQLVAFLKSLTDPAARNLGSVIPTSVPSGLPVR